MTEEKLTGLKKLALIQQEIGVSKNIHNEFGKFNYRNVESIYEAAKPLTDKYNCLLVMNDEVICIHDKNYIKAESRLLDIDSGTLIISVSAYAEIPLSKPKMSQEQVTGSASSYARKYSLGGLFLLDDNKDPDAGDNRKKIPIPKQKPLFDPTSKKLWNKACLTFVRDGNTKAIEEHYELTNEMKQNIKKECEK